MLGDEEIFLEVREIDGMVMRLDPDVPVVARVPRQAVILESPAGNRLTPLPRDVSMDWGLAGRFRKRWIFGTGLGVMAVVVGAMMALPRINKSNAARPRPGEGALVVERVDDPHIMKSVKELLTRQADAERIMRTVLAAPTAAEVLPWVREAAAVGPLIRASHRPLAVPKGWPEPSSTRWTVADNEGHPFGLLAGDLPDFSHFTAYWVLSGKRLQLDWKATTAFSTATFEDLARQRGDAAEIRGKILPDRYFTAVFPEAEYDCYQLAAPDDSEAIWCYVRRDDPMDAELGGYCHDGEIPDSTPIQQKITVRLQHGPAGSQPKQWLLAEVLHKEWISP